MSCALFRCPECVGLGIRVCKGGVVAFVRVASLKLFKFPLSIFPGAAFDCLVISELPFFPLLHGFHYIPLLTFPFLFFIYMISCSLLIQEMVPASEGTGHIDSRPDISTNDSHHSNHERRISPSRLDDAQIEALRDSLLVLQREKDRLVWCNLRLAKTIEEVTVERDELVAQRDEEFREKLQLQIESLVHHDRLLEVFEEKKSKRFQIFSKCFTLLESVGKSLVRIVERIGGDAGKETLPNIELKQDDELIMFMSKTRHVHTLAETLETNILQQEERGRKEKKQLELSIISLTEENRDISSLLRIAVVEKEAAEKATERLRGGGDQQKRAALLQYAEMGLQKVGFGFIMGAPAGNLTESTGSTVDSIVSSSEGEEEVFNSLVYTFLCFH